MLNKNDIWKLFRETGSIKLYSLYASMKEYKDMSKDSEE